MILTCPACFRRYLADETEFSPAGRNVRCTKCGHVWHQSAPELEGEPEPVFVAPEPRPSAFEPPPPQAYMQQPSFEVEPQEQEEEPKPRSPWLRRFLLGVGWVGLAAIVVLIFWTATVYRQRIVAAWPQSASLYSTLGLKLNAAGLKFDNVEYHQETEGGQATLVVTGKLVNISGRELSVPQIRATLSGDDKRELYHWTFMPAAISLHSGQTTRFVTRLSSPPAGVRHLDLRFATAGE